MNRHLLIGTHNPSRIDMVQKILHHSGVQILTLDELGIKQDVEEDQATTLANAEKKARSYFALSQIPTLAMDGGLHIERFAPDKQPGVLVKRIVGAGPEQDDDAITTYYQNALRQAGGESPGTWTGSQALAINEQQVIVSSFTFQVWFTAQRRGAILPGLSLDPLMIDSASGRYYTEIPVEERPYYRYIQQFLMEHIDLL
jgi:inosine/xanthosine triphosphate pyrophosphatase family protein